MKFLTRFIRPFLIIFLVSSLSFQQLCSMKQLCKMFEALSLFDCPREEEDDTQTTGFELVQVDDVNVRIDPGIEECEVSEEGEDEEEDFDYQERNVKNFSKIIIDLPDDIEIYCSIEKSETGEHGVTVSSYDEQADLNSVLTNVWWNGTLHVSLKRFCKKPTDIYISIEVESLIDLTIKGCVGCTLNNIETEVLNVDVPDYSEVELVNVRSSFMKIETSGESKVTLSQVYVDKELEIKTSEFSTVVCQNVVSNHMSKIRLSDNSEVHVTTMKNSYAKITALKESIMKCAGLSADVKLEIGVYGQSKVTCSGLHVVEMLEIIALQFSRLKCIELQAKTVMVTCSDNSNVELQGAAKKKTIKKFLHATCNVEKMKKLKKKLGKMLL